MSDMDYCKMLEIPVDSCNVVIKQSKKKKNVVDEVIDKVNGEEKAKKTKRHVPKISKSEKVKKVNEPKPTSEEYQTVSVKNSKFDIVSVQVVAIFVLIVGIILTNIFWEDSGMNNLMRQVFGSSTQKNNATYQTFSPTVPSKTETVNLENGVMTIQSGSVYSPCDGVVTSITESDGKYTVKVKHSESFTTVLSGLELCYLQNGDNVYGNVPLGYSSSEISVSMFDSDTAITNYVLNGNNIVWLT